jgi:hypothetical protein
VNQQLINSLSECIGHCQTDLEMVEIVQQMAQFAGLKTGPTSGVFMSPGDHIELFLRRAYVAEVGIESVYDNGKYIRDDPRLRYNKIPLIRLYREKTSSSLLDAKNYIEAMFGR